MSNTKQIGIAVMMYSQDNDEHVVLNNNEADPPNQAFRTASWPDLLQAYIKNDQIFICPSSVRRGGAPFDQLISVQGRRNAYVLNNVYWNHPNLGAIFEKRPPFRPAHMSSFDEPAGTVFCADGGDVDGQTGSAVTAQAVITGNFIQVNQTTRPPNIRTTQGDWIARHNDGLNVTFFDGHAKWLRIDEIGKTKPVPQANSSAYVGPGLPALVPPGMYFPYFTKLAD